MSTESLVQRAVALGLMISDAQTDAGDLLRYLRNCCPERQDRGPAICLNMALALARMEEEREKFAALADELYELQEEKDSGYGTS